MKFRLLAAMAVLVGLFMATMALAPVSFAASGDFFGSCAQQGVDCSVAKTNTNLQTPIWSIVRTALIALGGIAVIVIIIGGIMYATSTGDAGKVSAAKNTILYAVVGLVVAFMGSAIITIINKFFG